MCWLVVKPANKQIPLEYVDTAQELNSDGYGLAWFDSNTELQVFKTLDYDEFKAKLATLTPYDTVVHLRAASVGSVTLENVHPFPIPTGVMFHNGTISSLRPAKSYSFGKWDYTLIKWVDSPGTNCNDESDTLALANLISKCTYNHLSDIMPLIQHTVTTTSNKLVFAETDGQITIVNKSLGNEEDGIWYSNTYHVPVAKTTYSYCPKKYIPKTVTTKPASGKPEIMFVYGTLKEGYKNHLYMEGSVFLGKGISVGNWKMIGTGLPFPYLLGPSSPGESGHKVVGEVYEVPASEVPAIDRLEGVPYYYKKVPISITVNGKPMTASTYVKAVPFEITDPSILIAEWVPKHSSPAVSASQDSQERVDSKFISRVREAKYSRVEEAALQTYTNEKLNELADYLCRILYDREAIDSTNNSYLIKRIIKLQDSIDLELLSIKAFYGTDPDFIV